MAKVSLDDVDESLTKAEIDLSTRTKVLKDLEELLAALKAENAEKEKPPKKEPIIVCTDPNFDPDVPLFILHIEEGEDHNQIPQKVRRAVLSYNANKREKGKDDDCIETFGDACEALRGKQASEFGFFNTVKRPVIAIKTSNQIDTVDPQDEF